MRLMNSRIRMALIITIVVVIIYLLVLLFLGGGHPREYKSIIFWIMLVGYDFIIFVRNYKVYLTGIARRLQSTRFQ